MRIKAIFFGNRIGSTIFTIPIRNTNHTAAQKFNKANGCILRHITKALDSCTAGFWINFQVFESFAHGIDYTKAGSFGTAQRTTISNRFTGDDTRGILTSQFRILIHHPTHHLWGGTHVRSRNILAGTNVFPHLLHPAAHQTFFFTNG